MGHNYKFLGSGILIHTLELKLWHFEVFPYVCIGKPCVCNVFHPRATWNTRGVRYLETQNWSTYRQFALYGSTVHPRCIMWFSGQFIFSA